MSIAETRVGLSAIQFPTNRILSEEVPSILYRRSTENNLEEIVKPSRLLADKTVIFRYKS